MFFFIFDLLHNINLTTSFFARRCIKSFSSMLVACGRYLTVARYSFIFLSRLARTNKRPDNTQRKLNKRVL